MRQEDLFEEVVFPGVVLACPVVALFVVWLTHPGGGESETVGNWCAVLALVLLVLLLARRR